MGWIFQGKTDGRAADRLWEAPCRARAARDGAALQGMAPGGGPRPRRNDSHGADGRPRVRQLVECVPNYSEGRRNQVIDAIVAPFRGREGVHLLDWRADRDHNRLVVSLVGEPAPLQDPLMASARIAISSIDLRGHTGAHPRIGAVDVVPFVPLRGITMEECVVLARDFAARFARETGVPLYLYESAALQPERRNLEVVRKGQFERSSTRSGVPISRLISGLHACIRAQGQRPLARGRFSSLSISTWAARTWPWRAPLPGPSGPPAAASPTSRLSVWI